MKITVITPTWQRHHLLLQRCIPSVQAQTHPDVEHIVVCDGPDLELAEQIAGLPVTYVQMPKHPTRQPNFGSHLRNHALTLAAGDLVCYLDDDNTMRPDHIALLAAALTGASVDFAYSRMIRHTFGDVIGSEPPRAGAVDTSLLMHRRDLATVWPQPDSPLCDWLVVQAWLNAGAHWTHVPEVTVDYHWRGAQ